MFTGAGNEFIDPLSNPSTDIHSFVALFSRTVPSDLRALWCQYGGVLSNDKDGSTANYVFYYINKDLEDFDCLDLRDKDGTRVVFNAEWIRVSIEQGYPVAVFPFTIRHLENIPSIESGRTATHRPFRSNIDGSRNHSIQNAIGYNLDENTEKEPSDTRIQVPMMASSFACNPAVPQEDSFTSKACYSNFQTNCPSGKRSRLAYVRFTHHQSRSIPHATFANRKSFRKSTTGCSSKFVAASKPRANQRKSLKFFPVTSASGTHGPWHKIRAEEEDDSIAFDVKDILRLSSNTNLNKKCLDGIAIFRPGNTHDGKEFSCTELNPSRNTL
ncbi:hypothetical protein M422DRAFT_63610 [Sphaerobolus stellatus SS14]|nr:hypothetical protein M422DRAFT_63610 [Sphaerobolus stellatus SS14]